MTVIPWTYDDGGRAAAGFKGEAPGDCVVRAIAIATGLDYREVYDDLWKRIRNSGPYQGAVLLGQNTTRYSPRRGVTRNVYEPYLERLGWTWTPTMKIGSGTTVHLNPAELPDTRNGLIVRVSKHVTVLRAGIIRDTHDPSRGGTRAVYGYYTRDAS